jgi:hypothetical protein
MKNSVTLQNKLQALLSKRPDLRVSFHPPCSEETFEQVAWVVEDYVANSGDVTNDDPLCHWIEEYQFYVESRKSRVR